MVIAAAWRESSRDTNDQAFAAGKLFSKVDLVAGAIFDKLDRGDGIANFDLAMLSTATIELASPDVPWLLMYD